MTADDDALPASDGVALAVAHLGGTYGADQVDGTWCDVQNGDDDRVRLTLVGLPGATDTAARELRRALAALGPSPSPAATMDGLDRAARRIPGAAGSSALCVTLGPAGVVAWSGAGRARPVAVGPDGTRTLDGGHGPPLAGPDRSPSVQAQAQLTAGTTLVLGVGPDGPDAGAAVLAQHDLGPRALAAALEEAGQAERGTLVLARLLPGPLEQRLPADPRRLSAVRRSVAAWSAQAALSEDATADLQLLLSEAATNAVEHAYREAGSGEFVYSVRYRRDGGVRVSVQDFGRWRPPPDDPGYRGRGLAVIHNLAHEVTLDHTDHGTRVAFTVPDDATPLGERPLTGVTQGWKPG